MFPEYKVVDAKHKLLDFINKELKGTLASLSSLSEEVYIHNSTTFDNNFRYFLEELYEELSRNGSYIS